MLLTLIYILVCLNQLQVAYESVQNVPAICISDDCHRQWDCAWYRAVASMYVAGAHCPRCWFYSHLLPGPARPGRKQLCHKCFPRCCKPTSSRAVYCLVGHYPWYLYWHSIPFCCRILRSWYHHRLNGKKQVDNLTLPAKNSTSWGLRIIKLTGLLVHFRCPRSWNLCLVNNELLT